ncbi:DNA gyrase inhibitor YacG [Devosia algicola]|uniref:DNA gyrase inhibitor YacG n=1 Tax=Devosia algicola TaxID=3026418 RepID=A0ABY7YMC7_9HYPH|nr:DNA gyrase inhibitor YacG [Devosia algicola]WDR02372.1 DNA gyrase inhibitor YacG [Devosia algicola]
MSIGLGKSKPCPICKKPSVAEFHPFCSARCADVDLNRWLTGAYVIPARDDEATQDDEDGALGYNEDDNI